MLATKTKRAAMAAVEVEKLRERLEELEETLRAIRGGEVDALVVSGPDGDQVFTLQGAEHPYRVLVEAMSEGAATLTPEGTVLYCNSRLAEMLETPLEKLLGYSIYAYVHQEEQSGLARLLECGLRTSIKEEMTFKTARGASLPVYLSLGPYRKDPPDAICLVATDLTEQKRNQEIVAAEKLARSILEQAAEAIVVCDREGRIIRASEAAHRLCGRNPILQPFEEVFPVELASGEEFEPCEEQMHPVAGRRRFTLSTALGRQGVQRVEAEFCRNHREVFNLLLSARPLLGTGQDAPPEGDVLGCVIVLTDITERTRAEQALRESELRFRRLAESNIVGIISGEDDFIKEANDAFLQIVGYGRDELREGKINWREMTPPEYLPRAERARQECEQQGFWAPFEKEYIRKDGSRVPTLLGGTMLTRSPFTWAAFVLDLTDRKRAEAALQEEHHALELRVRERTAELAMANQELRNEVAERLRAQQALNLLVEVDAAAKEAEDIRTITSRCLEKICKLTGWRVGQAWFVDEREDALVCMPDAFYSDFDVTAFRKASLRERMRMNHGLLGRVSRTGAPVSIADVTRDPSFLRASAALKSGLRGAFAFPVKIRDKLLAIFEFFSPEAREPDPYFLDAVAKLSAHLALAYDRKRAEEELRQLSVRLLHLQDEERRRLGRELHDSTGQTLAALVMNLGAVSRSNNGIDQKARRLLSESLSLAKQCAQDIRTLSYLLHPPQLDREGLESALGWYTRGFTQRSGIKVRLDVARNLGRLSPEAEMALYRIVQESLANIHRHSGGRSAKIRIARDRGAVKLEVRDFGRGIPAGVLEGIGKGGSSLGVGIPGMRERVTQLGGWLEIGSGKRGTALNVVLPLPRGL